jgi:DNA-binding NtrC family response regulator
VDKISTLEDLQTFLEQLKSLYRIHETEFVIVEEEFHVKSMMETAITREGYSQPQYFKDGRQALQRMYDEEKKHLVIYNLRNPYLNGVEFLRQLTQKKPKQAYKVLLICTSENEKIAIQLMKMGAIGYLRKPFSAQDFTETLKKSNLL